MERARVHAYMELFETLRKDLRWKAGTEVLRIAALSLAAVQHEDPIEQLAGTADRLKKAAPWASPLRSTMLYAIAAMLLRRGLEPEAVVGEIDRIQKGFRTRKYRRGSHHEVLAALVLVLMADGRPVADPTIDRVGAILKRWKQDHPHITGYNDYPMAALHAAKDTPVEQIGRDVEEIYQALRRHRFSRGNQLQLASHILAITPLYPADAAMRFHQMAQALKGVGIRIGTAQYDEAALLVLSERDAGSAAREVLAIRDGLRTGKAKPMKSTALSLAVGLLLWDLSEREDLKIGRDAATLRAIQALLEAQQAAAMGVIIASYAGGAA